MRYTRIDIEGSTAGHFATATRKQDSEYLEVHMLTPNRFCRVHHVLADCREDIWSMAECLQYHLDGNEGTNSDIRAYFNALNHLAD